MFETNRALLAGSRRLGAFVIIVLLGTLLTGCQTYDGYPTTTPEPTVAPTVTTAPAPTARPVLASPPTATPRPPLPATPGGVQLQKSAILKEGFDALLNNYFNRLDSADLYEVGLRSIENGLQRAGIQNASVPLPQFGTQADANWNAFLQAFTIAVDKYKAQATEEDLAQVALLGAANSLQDCQTSYVPSSQAESFMNLRLGQYSTVGVGLNLQTGQLTNGRNAHFVLRVTPSGPAEKAGLKLGDQLTSVDGQDIGTKSSTEVVALLRGTNAVAGSKVLVTFRRPNTSQDQAVDLVRGPIQQILMERKTLPDNIGYLRFNIFPLMDQKELETRTKTLDTWLADFDKANVSGLVLDLRGNSIGSIGVVQAFLSRFITGDSLVILSGGRAGQNNTARQYGAFPMPSVEGIKATDKPLVVLVDGGTTAEAEIFAYAIQRGKRGTIVGQATAGCLNASSPLLLKDQSVMNITAYRVISDQQKPDSIVENVQPQENAAIDLQQLSQGKDSQLDAAVKVLKK